MTLQSRDTRTSITVVVRLLSILPLYLDIVLVCKTHITHLLPHFLLRAQCDVSTMSY